MYTPVVKDSLGKEWVWNGMVWVFIGDDGAIVHVSPKYFPTKKEARKVMAGNMSGWSVWFMTREEFERHQIGKAIQA